MLRRIVNSTIGQWIILFICFFGFTVFADWGLARWEAEQIENDRGLSSYRDAESYAIYEEDAGLISFFHAGTLQARLRVSGSKVKEDRALGLIARGRFAKANLLKAAVFCDDQLSIDTSCAPELEYVMGSFFPILLSR